MLDGAKKVSGSIRANVGIWNLPLALQELLDSPRRLSRSVVTKEYLNLVGSSTMLPAARTRPGFSAMQCGKRSTKKRFWLISETEIRVGCMNTFSESAHNTQKATEQLLVYV